MLREPRCNLPSHDVWRAQGALVDRAADAEHLNSLRATKALCGRLFPYLIIEFVFVEGFALGFFCSAVVPAFSFRTCSSVSGAGERWLFDVCDTAPCSLEDVSILLDTDELSPEILTGESCGAASHRIIEHGVTRVRVGSNQIFQQADRFLRRVMSCFAHVANY